MARRLRRSAIAAIYASAALALAAGAHGTPAFADPPTTIRIETSQSDLSSEPYYGTAGRPPSLRERSLRPKWATRK